MKNGFTLMELMITVAIVGILAAIAIPSYSAYIVRGNRTDATRTMILDSQALERCYSQTFTYANCGASVPATATSPQGYYTIAVTPTINSYSITARPLAAPQLSDTACKTFSLDNAGTQNATDSGANDTTKTCWGST